MTDLPTISPLDEPKGLIYHYTNQAGLLGILDKQQIWASHLRYLNDLEEYRLGVRLVEQVMLDARAESRVQNMDSAHVQSVLDSLSSVDFYAASFSQANDGDSLNLWRAYGRSIPGYSIGFDADKLRNVIRPTEESPGMRWLSKVHYIAMSQKHEVSEWPVHIITEVIKELDKYSFERFYESGKSVDEWVGILRKDAESVGRAALVLAAILPTLKDASFSDEIESRIIQLKTEATASNGVHGQSFHQGSWSIVPHMEIPISLRKDSPPIIERIIVGPCPHPDEAVKAVKMLLRSRNIDGVDVTLSQIPYRNW